MGELAAQHGLSLIERMVLLPIERIPHTLLLRRIWELRDNVSAYDALYISLAEKFRAPLLTRDGKLASASGHHAKVIVI
jgi:predicted nucleic acid-binding protein